MNRFKELDNYSINRINFNTLTYNYPTPYDSRRVELLSGTSDEVEVFVLKDDMFNTDTIFVISRDIDLEYIGFEIFLDGERVFETFIDYRSELKDFGISIDMDLIDILNILEPYYC